MMQLNIVYDGIVKETLYIFILKHRNYRKRKLNKCQFEHNFLYKSICIVHIVKIS